MNQDQVKQQLLKLNENVDDFNVTFSGKSSKKVDGLYKLEDYEIILHNKNFETENALIYTAIHEFAHHIQFTTSPLPISTHAHTIKFWDIFHKLLFDAEKKGIYNNQFKTNQEFIELTKKIKEKFLSANGQLMKDFGKLLMDAMVLCKNNSISFEDYVDRELRLHRTVAKTIIKTYNMDITPEIGFENMKTVAGVADDNIRKYVEKAFLEGKSPDMVKAEFSHHIKKEGKSVVELLEEEEDKLRKDLKKIKIKLADIKVKIREYQSKKV